MKAYAMSDQIPALDANTQFAIRYSREPAAGSRYTTRELAAADCVRLNQSRHHFGSHCCAFAVDQLPEGDFGIICACHPIATTVSM